MKKEEIEIRDVHPTAKLIPPPTDEEYAGLKEDIEKHGQREPVIVTPDGLLLDGRSRHRACQELGKPTEIKVSHADPSAYLALVLSLNLHRRHLDSSQRAILVAEHVLPGLEREGKERQRLAGQRFGKGKLPPLEDEDEDDGRPGDFRKAVDDALCRAVGAKPPIAQERAAKKAARMGSTNSSYVQSAKWLLQGQPELAQKVKEGKLKIPQAIETIKREGQKRQNKQIREIFEDNAVLRSSRDSGLPFAVEWASRVAKKLSDLNADLDMLREPSLRGLRGVEVQLEEHGEVKRALIRQKKRFEELLLELNKILDPKKSS